MKNKIHRLKYKVPIIILVALLLVIGAVLFFKNGSVKITKIDVSPTLTLQVGDVHPTEAVFMTDKSNVSAKKFEEAVNELNPMWESSDTDVVTVENNGTITAVGEGEATIVITTNDTLLFASIYVTVTPSEETENKPLEIESAGVSNDKTAENEDASQSETDSDSETDDDEDEDKNEDKKCPTCGSTSHTVHPTYTPKCQICGSTEHTTHPTCSVCGSYDHTTHPQYTPKCQICGSTEHRTHPTCPVCGSYNHTTHPTTGDESSSESKPTPTPAPTQIPDSSSSGTEATPTPTPSSSSQPTPTPSTPPTSSPTPNPTQKPDESEARCPTCGSTEHKVCYICPSCGIVHTS